MNNKGDKRHKNVFLRLTDIQKKKETRESASPDNKYQNEYGSTLKDWLQKKKAVKSGSQQQTRKNSAGKTGENEHLLENLEQAV